MSQETAKTEQTYEIVSVDGKFVAVVLPFREGRMPIKKTHINSSFCVELTCSDNTIEVLGNPARPCPQAMIELLRTHHEGMLLVELYEEGDARAAAFEPGTIPTAGEQMLRAPFLKLG